MKHLLKYKKLFKIIGMFPLAIFFSFPADIIPLLIQIISFIIWYKLEKI